ncbi:uncharacterized protein LOC127713091 [Mytilus californianus]|uniref:uncharacterized protein LOC127713091 n=1 Tax=Mytilus californianus TaxID=6549 RepID=UPI0022453FFF|nr:uncharacterized protein LOC127713091 [Mytilus californianus]XP_052075669.1 uncharacterized protein LOC127713091 [Mytilus californianus]XP_052075670.1 uncharacterized protein LOC127713091 [Mytilus californianus]
MKRKAKIRKTTMLVFGLYEGERCSLDVPIGTLVGNVKKLFQAKFNIYIDELNKKDRNILVLHYGGADLEESWCFTDLGIPAGSTIRVIIKEEVKPVLFIYCTYNDENIEIIDKDLSVPLLKIEDLRTLCAKKSGLPVSVFRLVYNKKELYDDHQLFDYGVEAGQTIRLENWDGWNEFINLCIMGFTPQVIAQISTEEVIARFQMKVALFIAAHYGNVDLARSLIKQGIRADEQIGEHPLRQWMRMEPHIETKKAPVHEATENNQLGVLRLMVNHDITCVMAKNGNDLAPLNIALRQKVKPCASFLLTRQWSKVSVGKFGALSVQTLSKVKEWATIAKERCFAKYGTTRSSLKKKSFTSGPLVSFGIPVVNGVTDSPMTGKPRSELGSIRKKSLSVFQDVYGINKEDPEQYFKQMSAVTNYKNMKLQKNTKWGNILDRTDMGTRFITGIKSTIEESEDEGSALPKKPGSTLGKIIGAKQRTLESISSNNEANGPPGSVISRARRGTVTSISEDDSEPTKPLKTGILGKLKGVLEAPIIDESNERSIRTPAKPAFRSKQLLSRDQTIEQTEETAKKPDQPEKLKLEDKETESKGTILKLPAIIKRKDQQTTSDDNVFTDNTTDVKENNPPNLGMKNPKNFFQTPNKGISKTLSNLKLDKTKTSTMISEVPRSPTHTEKSSATTQERKSRKRKRLTSALLISQAKASDGAVPLPLISTENMSRPFFYWNGLREEDYVLPLLDQVSKHKGATSRDRAIKSLTIANSFKEKPWLAQVRMATSLTCHSLRRSMLGDIDDDNQTI